MIEDILRTKSPAEIQPHSLRKWQQVLRDEIQPQLDALEAQKTAKRSA